MKSLKGIKRESHTHRLSSEEIMTKCLDLISKEFPSTKIASLYTLAPDGMRVLLRKDGRQMAFADKAYTFHKTFGQLIDGQREIELAVLDDAALHNHYLEVGLRERKIVDLSEKLPTNASDGARDATQSPDIQ